MADATQGRISAIPAGTGYGGDYRPLCPNAVSTICAIPAGIGYGGNYRPLCPNTVPTISRPLEASAPYTKVSAILGIVPAETPPPWCSLDTKSRPRAQSVHSGLHVHRRTHSEAVPGLPRRTGSDRTATSPQCSKDGPLRRPHRHRNRLQGPDTPPLFTRRRIVSSCTALVLPSCYKRRGPGLFEEEEGKNLVTHTHIHAHPCRLRATSQAARTTPCRDLGPAPSLL